MLRPKRLPSLSRVLQAGVTGRWQHGPITLALIALTQVPRRRKFAARWRPPPPRTGRRCAG
eukprot:11933874-Alexandrium_andersonii.AAC.1